MQQRSNVRDPDSRPALTAADIGSPEGLLAHPRTAVLSRQVAVALLENCRWIGAMPGVQTND